MKIFLNLKIKKIFIAKSFVIYFLLFTILARAQENITKQNSNHYLTQAKNYSKQSQYSKSLEASKLALQESIKESDDSAIAQSYYWMALNLCNTANYHESSKYLNILTTKYSEKIDENPEFDIKIADLIGRNYLVSGLTDLAVKEFKRELVLADLIKDKTDRKIHAYIQLSACFESNNADSTYYYLNKAKNLLKSTEEQPSILLLNLSDYHFTFTKNIDSAVYYNDKIIRQEEKNGSKYLHFAYLQKAKLILTTKNCNESLKYAILALKLSV